MASNCKIRACDLKHRITIYEQGQAASDGLGGFLRDWQKLVETRAQVKFSSTRDQETADTLVGASNATVMVRAFVGLARGMRVTIHTSTGAAAGRDIQYDCVGVDPVGDGGRWAKGYLRMIEHQETEA